MRREVCSLVVLYNPDAEVLGNIFILAQQSDYVFAINNGFLEPNIFFGNELKNVTNVELINLGRNEGIGFALNVGVRLARKMGFRWVATFDQDSRIGANFFNDMFNDYEKFKIPYIAVISPLYFSEATLTTTSYVNERYKLSNVMDAKFIDTTVTSGNIIDLYLVSGEHLFNDALFIDHIDNDFNLGIIDSGMFILETNVILNHKLGEQKIHKIMNKSPVSNNHSAFRRYFMTRNRIYMYKKYIGKHREWVMYDFRHNILEIIKIVLFEEDKYKKLRNFLLGIFHGIFYNIADFRSLNYRFTGQTYIEHEDVDIPTKGSNVQ